MFLRHTYIIETNTIDLEKVLLKKKNPFFQEKFRLLEKKSNTHLIFRYLLTGRIGYIKVIVKQKENNLIIEPFQSFLGFLVPIISFIDSLISFLLKANIIAVSMFCFGCFWLLLILFFFRSDSKKIRDFILESAFTSK